MDVSNNGIENNDWKRGFLSFIEEWFQPRAPSTVLRNTGTFMFSQNEPGIFRHTVGDEYISYGRNSCIYLIFVCLSS